MERTTVLPKEIVSYFLMCYSLKNMDWGKQMRLAQSMLKKYTGREIIFALNYYKDLGNCLYSLGWLTTGRMSTAITALSALENGQEGDSGERNRQRAKQNSEAKLREDSIEYLFAEPEQDN